MFLYFLSRECIILSTGRKIQGFKVKVFAYLTFPYRAVDSLEKDITYLRHGSASI